MAKLNYVTVGSNDLEKAKAFYDGLLGSIGLQVTDSTPLSSLWKLTVAQVAPVLPYLLLVVMLIFRPRGLMGTREG